MARDPKQLRKAYEVKIGKDRANKLSDDQIGLLSKFYNQLSESEQSDIDNKIFMGYSDTPLHQMAEEFISEKEDTPASVATGIIDEDEDEDDFEPLGLEELLGNIKEEAKRENALTLYQGIRQDDLVDEEIDERILRLIGLEEVFDIDYGTYLSLLKEKMIAARMTQKSLSTEESELITNEFRRVKGKVGRFTIKKKKIDVGGTAPIRSKKFLNPAEITKDSDQETKITEKSTDKKSDVIAKYLSEIVPIVASIRKLLQEQNDISKKIRAAETRRLEKERRKSRENDLEKGKKASKFLKNLKGALPSLGIFDVIKRFLTNVILGRAIFKFLKWMSDPENKKKLNSLGKFLRDWWPALLGAFVLFATPLGAFIRGTVGLIVSFTRFILSKAIPKLIMFAAKNPLIAAGLIAGGATLGAYLWNKKEEDNQVQKESKRRGVSAETVKREIEQEREGIIGQIGEAFNNIGPIGLSGGGIVPSFDKLLGFSNGGLNLGTDIIPAMLTPGESVLQVGARERQIAATGIDPLAFNAGPNANKPRKIGGVTYAAGGGPIGKKSNNPKISNADYATLLAISSLEDDKAQGRADVAQSLYNRLYSANKFGGNYNQGKNNTLKGLITAKSEGGGKGGGQYEPTFGNPQDWKNIKDLKTAAIAIMNSEKGKKHGYTMEIAMQQIKDTEKAISNPDLQKKAKEHVQGRTYFLGTSEQQNMRSGDVLRSPNHNFFSMWYDEKSQYGRARANIASPTPQRLLPKIVNKARPARPAGPKGIRESLTDDMGFSKFMPSMLKELFKKSSTDESNLGDIALNAGPSTPVKYDENMNMFVPNHGAGRPANVRLKPHMLPKASVTIPSPPVAKSFSSITLPPIAQSMGDSKPIQAMGSKDPNFPTVASRSIEVRNMIVDTYGLT